MKDLIALESLEKARLRFRVKLWVNFLIFVGLPGIGVPLMIRYQENRGLFFAILGLLMANFIRFFVQWGAIYSKYVTFFNEEILEPFVSGIYPDLRFDPEDQPPLEDIDRSLLFREVVLPMVECSGAYLGRVESMDIGLWDITAKKPNRNRSDNTQWDILFNGLLFRGKVEQAYSEPVVLLTRFPMAGSWLAGKAGLPVADAPALELGLPDLEKRFVVHADSEETARKVLTPQRIAVLLEMEASLPHRYSMRASFVEDFVYAALENGGALVTPSVRKSFLKDDQARGMLKTVEGYLAWARRLA